MASLKPVAEVDLSIVDSHPRGTYFSCTRYGKLFVIDRTTKLIAKSDFSDRYRDSREKPSHVIELLSLIIKIQIGIVQLKSVQKFGTMLSPGL